MHMGHLRRIANILGHKTISMKFLKIKIIESMFSSNNGANPEMNENRKIGQFTNMIKLNNAVFINQWVKKEITRNVRKNLESYENKNTTYQSLWDVAKAVMRRKFIR